MPLTKEQYDKLSKELLKKWDEQIRGYHAYTIARTTQEWQRLAMVFQKMVDDLVAKGDGLSPDQIYRLAEYREFVKVAKAQAEQYARFSTDITKVAQGDLGNLAVANSTTLMNLIKPSFGRVSPKIITSAIGYTSDGSPLYELFKQRFDNRASLAAEIFVNGIARGINPVKIASDMRKQLDISVYDSNRICRSESLNLYRNVSYQNYLASGVVERWNWNAASDACTECLEFEAAGPYAISQEPPTSLHPHDRCSVSPAL